MMYGSYGSASSSSFVAPRISGSRYSATAARAGSTAKLTNASATSSTTAAQTKEQLSFCIKVQDHDLRRHIPKQILETSQITCFSILEFDELTKALCIGTNSGSIYVIPLSANESNPPGFLMLPSICWFAGAVKLMEPTIHGTLAAIYDAKVISVWKIGIRSSSSSIECISRSWTKLQGNAEIRALAWSYLGNLLFIGDAQGTLRAVNSNLTFHRRIILQHPSKSPIYSLKASPISENGLFSLACSHEDGTVTVLRMQGIEEEKFGSSGSEILKLNSQCNILSHGTIPKMICFYGRQELVLFDGHDFFSYSHAQNSLSRLFSCTQLRWKASSVVVTSHELLGDLLIMLLNTGSSYKVIGIHLNTMTSNEAELHSAITGNLSRTDHLRLFMLDHNGDSLLEIYSVVRKAKSSLINELHAENLESKIVVPLKKKKQKNKIVDLNQKTPTSERSVSPSKSRTQSDRKTSPALLEKLDQLHKEYCSWKRENGPFDSLGMLCVHIDKFLTLLNSNFDKDSLVRLENTEICQLVAAGFLFRASQVYLEKDSESSIIEFVRSNMHWLTDQDEVIRICSRYRLMQTFIVVLRHWKVSTDGDKEKVVKSLFSVQKCVQLFKQLSIASKLALLEVFLNSFEDEIIQALVEIFRTYSPQVLEWTLAQSSYDSEKLHTILVKFYSEMIFLSDEHHLTQNPDVVIRCFHSLKHVLIRPSPDCLWIRPQEIAQPHSHKMTWNQSKVLDLLSKWGHVLPKSDEKTLLDYLVNVGFFSGMVSMLSKSPDLILEEHATLVLSLNDESILHGLYSSISVHSPIPAGCEKLCRMFIVGFLTLFDAGLAVDAKLFIGTLCIYFSPLLVFNLCKMVNFPLNHDLSTTFARSALNTEKKLARALEERKKTLEMLQRQQAHAVLNEASGQFHYRIVHIEDYLKQESQDHNLHAARCQGCTLAISVDNGSENDVLKLFPCGHVFHFDCYDFESCPYCDKNFS